MKIIIKMIMLMLMLMVPSSLDAFSFIPLPKLIIFDIDNTLWPSWNYNRMYPPFRRIHTKVFDNQGKLFKPFPESHQVLEFLYECNILVAVASRTGRAKDVAKVIELLYWKRWIHDQQLYTDVKSKHVHNISVFCNIKYKDIIFFDNEQESVDAVKELGVFSILVPNGISMQSLEDGIIKFVATKSSNPKHSKNIKTVMKQYQENYF